MLVLLRAAAVLLPETQSLVSAGPQTWLQRSLLESCVMLLVPDLLEAPVCGRHILLLWRLPVVSL